MGLLFLDSFDDRYFAAGSSYASYHAKWDDISEDAAGGYLLEQVTGRTGKACKLGGNSYLNKTGLNIVFQALTWGVALKVTSAPVSETSIVTVKITSGLDTYYITYKLLASLYVKVYDTTGFELATSSSALSLDTFYYIESSVDITGSTITLYKDGSNWFSVPNVAPAALTEATIDAIKFSGGITIDDLYLTNNNSTRLGSIKIDAVVPNANTSLTRTNPWTANYTNVDECYQANHDGTTTYDVSNTASPSSVSYNFTDASSMSLYGIQSCCWVSAYKITGSPGNITFSAITNVSGTDYEYATTKILAPNSPAVWSLLRGVWENNPATSTSWTTSTYNSAEFGVKSSGHVSGQSSGYLTAITLEMGYIATAPEAGSRVFIIS
jgi:hypothetical protein